MPPEWYRRLLAIMITTLYAAISRKFEAYYVKIGLDPVWITRITAVGVLILCFHLADKIPDANWPQWKWRWRTVYGVYLLLVLIWVAVFLGVSGGGAR